ncbi:MAG: proline dehydrogenase family protein [Saprospiraceae bacterium]|nr:proline dehydrogenase family protein [Saprospiraceae bacterium]
MSDPEDPHLDFNNTEIAFSYKSNRELRKTWWLFRFMNNPNLVKIGTLMGNLCAKLPFGLGDPFIKWTIFEQFCGGTNLFECEKVIDKLSFRDALTILDYGVEAKERDEDFERTLNENLKAVEFAYAHSHVPVISTKITGYVPMKVLEKMQSGDQLSDFEEVQIRRLNQRMDSLCKKAFELGVSVFIDAEESWIQKPIDELAMRLMAQYNRKKPIIYQTFQLYRQGQLEFLHQCYELAKSSDFILGAKIVRGAYMEKERKRASDLSYPDPIHPTKEATDLAYNEAVKFCVNHYERISMCNSSHNWESNMLQTKLMQEAGIAKDHPHLNFCQLYGMSDNLTFNLSSAGYNAAKYLPYGPTREVVPYLTRRAQENTSVTGDMGRELKLLNMEMRRRGLLK